MATDILNTSNTTTGSQRLGIRVFTVNPGASGVVIENTDLHTIAISTLATKYDTKFDDYAYISESWMISTFDPWKIPANSFSGCILDDVVKYRINDYTYSKSYLATGDIWTTTALTTNPPYLGPSRFFPTVPSGGDAVAFGYSVPFCEKHYSESVLSPAIYTDTGVLEWSYSIGENNWNPLTIVYDGTNSGVSKIGDNAFSRDGAISFIPPTGWVSSTIDGRDAYWIKATIVSGKQDDIIQSPGQWDGTAYPSLIFPTGGFICPRNRTIEDMWVYDRATTVHAGTAVKFILMNFTTGQYSGEHTWAIGQGQDAYTGLALTVSSGDRLGIMVTQEDSGNNDPTNVMLELGVRS